MDPPPPDFDDPRRLQLVECVGRGLAVYPEALADVLVREPLDEAAAGFPLEELGPAWGP